MDVALRREELGVGHAIVLQGLLADRGPARLGDVKEMDHVLLARTALAEELVKVVAHDTQRGADLCGLDDLCQFGCPGGQDGVDEASRERKGRLSRLNAPVQACWHG